MIEKYKIELDGLENVNVHSCMKLKWIDCLILLWSFRMGKTFFKVLTKALPLWKKSTHENTKV